MDAEFRASEGEGSSGGNKGASGEVSLDLLDPAAVRARARLFAIAALITGVLLGIVVGVLAGMQGSGMRGFSLPAFVATTVIVAGPLLLLAYSEARKTYSLSGTRLAARALGTRVVDLGSAQSLDILVTDMRGMRTISLLAGGPPKGRTLTVPLAMYAGAGGRELGVYALRRLADALAASGDTRALVLSELLVAQLRAEARSVGAAQRPLYRLASQVPKRRVTQTLSPDTVAHFVTTLD